MDAADFRRLALALEGSEEGSHRGSPDFRVEGATSKKRSSKKQKTG